MPGLRLQLGGSRPVAVQRARRSDSEQRDGQLVVDAGQGSWSSGRASGTICTEDKGGGLPTRNLVLRVSGSSTLSPKITKLGLPGVGIVLPVTVSATDDAACPRGTPGSVTLFASYYSVHRDSIVMHFASACSSHDHSFTGTIVHVEIARNGHQVNTAGA